MASRSETVSKYMKKAGWLSKSYTLKKDIVEAFKEACESQGVSQASFFFLAFIPCMASLLCYRSAYDFMQTLVCLLLLG